MFRRITFAMLLMALFAAASLGATYTVTKTDDTNDGTCDADCSLREAVERTNQTGASDIIIFDPTVFNSPQIIQLFLGGDLNITNSLQLTGPGARLLTIRQQSLVDRVFDVSPGVSFIIQRVTVSGGQARSLTDGQEGGGFRNAGTLAMLEVAVCDNEALAHGGGVYSSGTLFITRSLSCRNFAGIVGNAGGGVFIAGGTATVENSTISGNAANSGNGGGIGIVAGTLNLLNSTVALNTALGFGAGISLAALPTVNVRNSLIGDNLGPNDAWTTAALFNSNGNNLVENVTPGFGFTNGVNGDIVGVTPALGTLADNGGPTDSHRLLPGSPAIDAGQNCVLNSSCGPVNNATMATDQRGTGYARLNGTNVDIGAFEYAAPTAAPVSISGRVMDEQGGIRGAFVTLTAQDGNSKRAVTNSFGSFLFEGIEAGQTVFISTFAKSYIFEPVFLTVSDSVFELNITPLSSRRTDVSVPAVNYPAAKSSRPSQRKNTDGK